MPNTRFSISETPHRLPFTPSGVLLRRAPFYDVVRRFFSAIRSFYAVVRRFPTRCGVFRRGAGFFNAVRRFMPWCGDFSNDN